MSRAAGRGRGRGRGRRSRASIPSMDPDFMEISDHYAGLPEPQVSTPDENTLENDHVISMQHWNDNVNTFEPGPSNVEYPGSAKRKRTESPQKANLNETSDEVCCSICYEPYDKDGSNTEHRLCSLKCGHLFGKSCIQRWIQSEGNSSCPTCKTKSTVKDIRILFGQVGGSGGVDNTEFNRLKDLLKVANEENTILRENLARVQNELEETRQRMSVYEDLNKPIITQFKLTVKKLNLVTNLGNSVKFVCAPTGEDFVIAGCNIPNRTSMMFGVARAQPNAFCKIPLHDKIVRSVSVNPVESNLFASTSDDDRLRIFDSSKKANHIQYTYNLPYHGWAVCWMSLLKVAVGLNNGRVLCYSTGSQEFDDLTDGVGDKPILSLSFDHNHKVLFICSNNAVRVYRNGVLYTLLEKINIASFYFDQDSGCFLLTIPPIQGKKRTTLQLYKMDFTNLGTVKLIGEHETNSNRLTKNTVNVIWSAPTDQLLCAFFDEDRLYTLILNWGKPEERKLDQKPAILTTIKHVKEDHVVHYAKTQKQVVPSELAPSGTQNILYMVTSVKMLCYNLIYS